jgi:hypothetical protein
MDKINPACKCNCTLCKANKAPCFFKVTFSGFAFVNPPYDDNRVLNRTYILKHVPNTCTWKDEHNVQVDTAPGSAPPPYSTTLNLNGGPFLGYFQDGYNFFEFNTVLTTPIDCCNLNLTIDKNTPGDPGRNGGVPLYGKCTNVPGLNCVNVHDNDGATAVITALR